MDMALSKDEQRTLDEIEHGLRTEDPRFVDTVNFDHIRRHRAVVTGSVFLVGIALLILGEIVSQSVMAIGVIVSITGFVLMFAAFAWDLRRR
jgi:hypothetical protein